MTTFTKGCDYLKIVSLFENSTVMLALRHYNEYGPFYIIKLRRTTGEILSSHRVDTLPVNWTEDFKQEIKGIADRFIVNSSRKIQ
ncbi:hypothetical protein SAMN04487897_13112 [Paenibacillus sp. yr247]|uniref:hypothetical protein n=1 Tax=Paenibacillus sp. yr247 TaxID=1761880 RepID=UPI0008833CF0|nr:hypothetical protein [Paenibacillus sp. yr247]SDP01955.1 hypothetical protein SAMN04487897_13112 [Paenibacillus sp. yr247]